MESLVKGLLTAFLALSFCFSRGQTKKLRPGDHLPDLVLPDVLNYKATTLNLASLKGKNIIIDFWNHKCIPCIKAFPGIDSLQRMHNNDLQFILVNKESREATEKFFKVRKNIKMPSVPLVTGDKLLASIFPHDGYPYSVWINKEGIIQYFSGGYNTTEEHVMDFISGKPLNLFDQTSMPKEYGILKDPGLAPLKFEFYSCLAHCNRRFDIGSPQREVIDSGRLVRLALNCSSILNLIKAAYGEWGKYNFQASYALDIKVKNAYRLDFPGDRNLYDNWIDSNLYSYEQWIPASRMDERFTIMQDDLERYFNLDIKIEYRKVKSLALSILDVEKLSSIKSKGEEPADDLSKLKYGDSSLASYRLINYPFYKLTYYLRSWFISYPFFSECDFKSNVDFIFKKESLVPLNFQLVQEELKAAGLYLRFEEREIPVLVIRDK